MERIEEYDIADDIETQEDVLAYLNEVTKYPDDAELLLASIGEISRSRRFEELMSSRELAASGY